MDILLSFLVSIIAGIVVYYICKWLDEDDSDNSLKKTLGSDHPRVFALCAVMEHYSLFA